MKVLGLSSNYHDASAALVIDGQVVAAAAEERFTMLKHDPGFPALSADFCLKQAGITADDLDAIAYHEDPSAKFSRTLASSFARFPFSLGTFVKSMREAITGGFWVKNRISAVLDVDPRKIVFIPHHCGHAAQGFLTSPFEEAAIMTLDAAGEWMCSGTFRGKRSGVIEPLAVVPFPHSLGLVYSTFTGFLGFKVNDGECSTMALAAFGEPRYADEVRKIIQPSPDGTYQIDASYFDFSRDDSLPITEKFVAAFGQPRPYKTSLPYDCFLDGRGSAGPEMQKYADVAASVQHVLEETVLRMAKHLRERTGLTKLCLSGGVALNCVAMGKLIESGIFEDVFVPPDPGDGGGALGAALYHSYASGAAGAAREYHPYLGAAVDEHDMLTMFPHLQLRKKVKLGVQGNFDSALKLALDGLEAGKIVGWVQDRFEVGPRALGNRSIFCDPSRVDVAKRLSRQVKKRAPFRPYACSVADFERSRVFGAQKTASSPAARWMQTSSTVADAHRAGLRAAMHVDGTTRPHICDAGFNPRLHRLLSEWGKRKGLAALLNTSFNESGMPMVATAVDAFLMFVRTDMDILVVGDSAFVKEDS